MTLNIRRSLAAFALGLCALAAQAQERVVYHIDDAATQGLKGLRNVRNHLDTEPATQIVRHERQTTAHTLLPKRHNLARRCLSARWRGYAADSQAATTALLEQQRRLTMSRTATTCCAF
jgi:hypothetical protein